MIYNMLVIISPRFIRGFSVIFLCIWLVITRCKVNIRFWNCQVICYFYSPIAVRHILIFRGMSQKN